MSHRIRLLLGGLVAALALQAQNTPLGIFETNADIGVNPKAGSAEFAAGEYRITGGGANLWFDKDAFQFVYRRMTGDMRLTADVRFPAAGTNAHRKALLMVRQELSPGSAYADIAVHGDGLTSLQYRPSAGANTLEKQAAANAPVRIRIERRGNQIQAWTGNPGSELTPVGPIELKLSGPVYVGLGVCSHDENVLETAVFSNVQLEPLAARPRFSSQVVIFDLKSRQTRVVHSAPDVVEAPNWSRDGKFLIINTNGNLYRVPVQGEPKLEQIVLQGGTYRCNNDHDITRDGSLLGFSASVPGGRGSQVFVAKADGSDVKLLTPATPSYFHGWSPDNQWLAFVGQRQGKFHLFRVSVNGGEEQRLTSAGPYDDGPEYSPDGRYIYFNSLRSGGWDLWRMPASGAGEGDKLAERVTSDDMQDWFPHFSPNGKHLIWISFPKGTEGHNDRMPGMQLRYMKAPGAKLKPAKIQVLKTFFGGQGTINVNSWSPDSKQLAFVIYAPVTE